MKNIYYKIIRDIAAVKILSALVSSPERYKYIASKVESGELTNRTATEKNVTKAILMADQLIDGLKQRSDLDK